MILQAKKLWETLRVKKTDASVRAKYMADMMDLITGHIQDVNNLFTLLRTGYIFIFNMYR
jgi:hypothetical protein